VFVHLHCHSHYSFLRGVSSPDEIIAAAVEQNMPAVALTDTNGMHAAVSFYKKAKDKHINPIVGVTLDVEGTSPSFRAEREIRPGLSRHSSLVTCHSTPMVLLAMDMEGYSNLCQLTTLRHLGTTNLASLPVWQTASGTSVQNGTAAETDGCPVTFQRLAKHSRGVIALCPLPAGSPDTSNRRGTIHCAPTDKNTDGARLAASFAQLKDVFSDRL